MNFVKERGNDLSKLYNKYLELKNINSSKYYLFLSGIFYIFLDTDAKVISNITKLKLSKLNDNIYKCGFPKSCLSKYLVMFKKLNIDVEIIESIDNKKDIINKIKNIKLEGITPIEAYQLLKDLKEYYE